MIHVLALKPRLPHNPHPKINTRQNRSAVAFAVIGLLEGAGLDVEDGAGLAGAARGAGGVAAGGEAEANGGRGGAGVVAG